MRSVFLAFCRGVCYNIGNIPGDRKNRGVITDEKYKIAALLMIIHGGFMEIGGVLCMIPALLLGTDKFDIGQYFSFKLSYFQENLSLMIVMGAMYGVLRLIGANGLLKNRMWGLVLAVITCVITLLLMMFLLPAGIMDGILAGSVLILLLTQYFGDKKIGDEKL